jgi:hypothetical protein
MLEKYSDDQKFMTKPRKIFFLLLLAGVLRLGYVFSLEEKYSFFDTAHYDSAAKSILAGNGFGPSLHYYDRYEHYCLEPVYPLALAGIYALFGQSYLAVRIIQALLSLLQIYFIYRITLIIRPAAALYALAFAAVYPFFIYISGLLYSTQVFSLLLTMAVFFFCLYSQTFRLKWLTFGAIAIGLSIATIPVCAPTVALFALWIVFINKKKVATRAAHVALLGILVVLVLAPWTIRNWLVFKVISPGRACLAESRAFEQVDLQFRYDDSFKQRRFEGRQFRVEILNDGDKLLFDYFLDDAHLGTLKILEDNWIWPDTAYFGLIFRGGSPLELPAVEFSPATQSADLQFDDSIHSSELSVHDGRITLQTTPEKWGYSLVFTRPDSFTRLTMTYPDSVTPQDVQRFAFLVGMDAPSLTADGYMIWLHPWKDADLWQVKDGRPFRSLDVIDLVRKQNPMTLSRLVAKEPVRYFTQHFIPEFFKFWSPVISRVTTNDYQPGVAQEAASILFFTPLLLFSLIGLVVLFKIDLMKLLLLLIPLVVLSLDYAIFFVEIRYRIPIDGFLIILASIGFSLCLAKVRKKMHCQASVSYGVFRKPI